MPICWIATSNSSLGCTRPTNLQLHRFIPPARLLPTKSSTIARVAALVNMPWVIGPGRPAYSANILDTWIGLKSEETRAYGWLDSGVVKSGGFVLVKVTGVEKSIRG